MKFTDPSEPIACSADAVVSWLEETVGEDDSKPLATILEELAEAFAADGAGLSVVSKGPAGSPVPYLTTLTAETHWGTAPLDLPWERDPAVFARMPRGKRAVPFTDADGNSWLIATIGEFANPWLVWIVCKEQRDWTARETGLLSLAGKCLLDRLPEGSAEFPWSEWMLRTRLQEKLDISAAVTRRLAHDFCNILTSVSGFAELSTMSLKPDHPAYRHARDVLESARRGAQWCQKLQVFCQHFEQRHVPSSLTRLLAEEALLPHWAKGIDLKVDLASDLPSAAVEIGDLRQVLGALLENARDALAGQSHGTVSVSACPVDLSAGACLELLGNPHPGLNIEVNITDSGKGLTPEVQAQLFRTVFFSTKGRRRGLGLAGVYGTLKSYGAGFRLGLSPEGGVVVQVYLPASGPSENTSLGANGANKVI